MDYERPAYAWRNCKHCNKQMYSTEGVLLTHEEDCDKRPRKQARCCPKCGMHMQLLTINSWICPRTNCDFFMNVLNGGKLT